MRKSAFKRSIISFDLGNEYVEVFESAKEAERVTRVDSSHISKCCQGKQKTAEGFLWKYV